MSNTDDQIKETNYLHERFMRSICEHIAKNKLPVTLKGGTALLLCYGLDRHSEVACFIIQLHKNSFKYRVL